MRRALALLLLATGCGTQGAPVGRAPAALLAPGALSPVSAEDDPLATHRPPRVDCPPATWRLEGSGFEVQTGACNYAAFDQLMPVAAYAGDALAITVWHDTLDAIEPASGHLAVLIDGAVLWEATVSIPAPSRTLEALVPLESRAAEGARLGIHLHNHGYNSWRFVSIDLRPR
jgi:hypothetical protein